MSSVLEKECRGMVDVLNPEGMWPCRVPGCKWKSHFTDEHYKAAKSGEASPKKQRNKIYQPTKAIKKEEAKKSSSRANPALGNVQASGRRDKNKGLKGQKNQ